MDDNETRTMKLQLIILLVMMITVMMTTIHILQTKQINTGCYRTKKTPTVTSQVRNYLMSL